jgi:small subunit ribosomal protein S9
MEKKKIDKKNKEEEKVVEEKTSDKTPDIVEFSGEYLKAVGRRKTAVAQVRLYKKGKGAVVVNQKKASHYFSSNDFAVLNHFLKTINVAREYNFSVLVKGGGKSAQAEAVRHGLARVLLATDEELRDMLRLNGFLTRDHRQKERKKPGLKGARKRPQWSKR